jgi:plastocyanin
MRAVLILLVLSSAAYADSKGTIKGTVIFEGEAPDRPKLVRDTDPVCAKVDKLSEEVVVTKGRLKDVLVRVKNGSGGKHAAPQAPVAIDQKDCMYAPRVVGVVAGQKLGIRNSDGTFHNVRGTVDGKRCGTSRTSKGEPSSPSTRRRKPATSSTSSAMHPDARYAVVRTTPILPSPVRTVLRDQGPRRRDVHPRGVAPYARHKTTVKIGVGPKAAVTARFSYKK